MALSSESLYNIFKSGQVYSAPKKYTRVTYQPGPYDPLSLIKFPIGVWKPPSANYDDFVLKSAESFASKGPIDRTLVQLYGTKKRAYIDNPSHTGYTPQDEPMTSYSPYHKMPQSLTRHVMQRVEEDNEYYSLKHKSWQKGYKNTEQKTNTWVSPADDDYTQQILKEYKISHGLAPADTEKGVLTEDVRLVQEEANNKKFMDRLRDMDISSEEYKRIMGVNPAQLRRMASAKISFDEVVNKYNATKARLDDAVANKGAHQASYIASINKYNKLQNELASLQASSEPTVLAKYSTDYFQNTYGDISDDDLIVDVTEKAAFLAEFRDKIEKMGGLPSNAAKAAELIGFTFRDIKSVEFNKSYKEEIDKAKAIAPDQEKDNPDEYKEMLKAAEVTATKVSENEVKERYETSVRLSNELLPIIKIQEMKVSNALRYNRAEAAKEDTSWRKSFADYTVAVDNIKSHPAMLKQYDIDRISAENEHKSSVIDDVLYTKLEKARTDQKAEDAYELMASSAASKKTSDDFESQKRKEYESLINAAIRPFATRLETVAKLNDVRRSADMKSLNTSIMSLRMEGSPLAIDLQQQKMANALEKHNAITALPPLSADVKSKSSVKADKKDGRRNSGLNMYGNLKGANPTRTSGRRASAASLAADSRRASVASQGSEASLTTNSRRGSIYATLQSDPNSSGEDDT